MLSEEERKRRTRLQKHAKHLADMGRPQRVLPHEYEAAMRILERAHESGMSFTQIATQLGNQHNSTVQKLLKRKTKSMHRDTYNRIMKLQPELPARLGTTRRGGARMDPRTTTRRLRALLAVGWTAKSLEPYMGFDQRNLSELILGQVKFVYAFTQREIALAYDKLQYMDPVANGASLVGSRRAVNRGRSEGWAPAWAWDEDTIDDLDAHPEWTGACGTVEGYRIHIRETFFGGNPMPPCPPCKGAVEKRPPTLPRKYPLRLDVLNEALGKLKYGELGPLSDRVIPESTNARDTVCRYRDGSRSPRKLAVVERLAYELGLTVDDLVDYDAMNEAGEVAAPGAPGTGHFNPYVLRVALDLSGMSHHKLSMVPGFTMSAGAIGKWVAGEMKPRNPEALIPIAKYFGVNVEVFYS